MAADQVYRTLAGLPLFRELDHDQLNLIAENSRRIELKKGQYVFRKGDPANGFYTVIKGWISIIFLSSEGKEHVARIVDAGQSFGEAVMFLEKPFPGNALANTNAEVLFVRKQVVFDSIDNSAGFARRMIAGLSQRLHNLSSELELLTLQTSQQRVISYLLQDQNCDENKQQAADINLVVNKATIAAHLHLTPETLSRTLHSLSERELLHMEGKMIHIPDVGKLRKYADSSGPL